MTMTFPLVGFPDTEQDAVDYLREFLAAREEDFTADVEVHTREPVKRAPVAVMVRRVGGVNASPYLDTTRLQVQVWHTSDTTAQKLAALCRAALAQARNYRSFRGHRNSGGLVAVPDKTAARYLFTVEFTVKGATP